MSNIILSIKNLTVRYENLIAIDNINLEVENGDFLAIIGPNGGGKTTFLKAILGLLKMENGEILIAGKSLEKNRHLIGYVPQFSLVDRKFPISVLEVVMTGILKPGLHPFFKYSKLNKELALEKLKLVGIENLADRQIADLSGGEFQRLLIARALATEPQILFLDEPTASVDPKSTEQIYDVLNKINETITIVMVTHDLFAVSKRVKNIACLNKTLVYHGGSKLTEEVVNHMYNCPVELIAHGVPHRVLDEHHNCEHKNSESNNKEENNLNKRGQEEK